MMRGREYGWNDMEINDFFDGLFLGLGLRRDEKNRTVSDKVQFLGIKRNKYKYLQVLNILK